MGNWAKHKRRAHKAMAWGRWAKRPGKMLRYLKWMHQFAAKRGWEVRVRTLPTGMMAYEMGTPEYLAPKPVKVTPDGQLTATAEPLPVGVLDAPPEAGHG